MKIISYKETKKEIKCVVIVKPYETINEILMRISDVNKYDYNNFKEYEYNSIDAKMRTWEFIVKVDKEWAKKW